MLDWFSDMGALSLNLLTRLLSDRPDTAVIAEPANWKIVKENAARHGVAPLIAFVTRPHVDTGERAWCDRILAASWKRHSRSLQCLEDLTGILEDAGIT